MVSHTICQTLKGDRIKEDDNVCWVTTSIKRLVSRTLLAKIKAVLGTNFLITNCVYFHLCSC